MQPKTQKPLKTECHSQPSQLYSKGNHLIFPNRRKEAKTSSQANSCGENKSEDKREIDEQYSWHQQQCI